MKLATKVSLTVIGVLSLGIFGTLEGLLVARETGHILEEMVTDNLASVRAAEELEIGLLDQRGLVSSYILDHGNPRWLVELQTKKASFTEWLRRAEETAHTAEEQRFLTDLKRVYRDYDERREQVISSYTHGDAEQATTVLLHEVNGLYRQAYASCEGFIAANEQTIAERSARARTRLRSASVAGGILVLLTVAWGAGLLVLFLRGVLRPLRRMAEDARAFSVADGGLPEPAGFQDELRAVGYHLRSLMSDVAETHSVLERSRMQLVDSDKLASLGRLAASIGHEIRNPLTSIEMRLYSIREAVGDNREVEEDVRVVSEEIAHLENTVRNFLEFARPPHPCLKPHEIGRLLDKTMELCGHWLAERGIEVERQEAAGLPRVKADSEQIKQVFLNLLRNAAEAMEEGGRIKVTSSPATGRGGQEMVMVRFQDSGPGIPPEVRARILEPFFSTKPEGTGLGLCIAARILAQHQGRIELEPAGERGASFAVWIPAAEEA